MASNRLLNGLAESYRGPIDCLKKVISTSVDKLDTYRKDLNSLKDDADGMFLIVRGEAQCV